MAKAKDADKDQDAAKDEDKAKAGAEGEAGAEAKPKGRFAFLSGLMSRKMLMFVVAPVVLLLLVGGGAYFFLFSGGEEAVVAEGEAGAAGEHGAHGEAAAAAEHHPVFFEVPDILVNVAAGGDKPAFLKLSVSLELEGEGEEATAAVEPLMPRIVDQLQTYLRELRVEDLSGSAATFRLKEELLRRVNLAVEPVKVKDVLFREMIVQ
ncbi:MAG: flagellar basal body-associated FliL family protein [Alphaproteobacteria bacterium]|nr:flagellar basal body-associated FliL family protein [Alphaproteobacteria bacterium]